MLILSIPLIRVLLLAVLSLPWLQKDYNQITTHQVLLLKKPGMYSAWFFCHQHNQIEQKVIDNSTNLDSQTKKLKLPLQHSYMGVVIRSLPIPNLNNFWYRPKVGITISCFNEIIGSFFLVRTLVFTSFRSNHVQISSIFFSIRIEE